MTPVELSWEPSAAARRAATLAALLTGAGALTGRVALWLLAVVPLTLLLAAGRRRPSGIRCECRLSATRCIQGDDVTLYFRVQADIPVAHLKVTIRAAQLMPSGPVTASGIRTDSVSGVAVLHCSGRGEGAAALLDVAVRDAGGRWLGRADLPAPGVRVFPTPVPLRRPLAPRVLPPRGGTHVAAVAGAGTELVGIRAFQPGDTVRQINWPVSMRMSRWYVTERAAERGGDVVAVIDAFSDVADSLSRAVDGALAVVLPALAAGDRAGLVILGGRLRWLTPQVGELARYRILDLVMDARRDDSRPAPTCSRVPAVAAPPGALLVLFTPLLDPRALAMATDLVRRGVQLVIVDVLTVRPVSASKAMRASAPATAADLADRLWRWDRLAALARFGQHGAAVAQWNGADPLGPILAAATAPARARGAP